MIPQALALGLLMELALIPLRAWADLRLHIGPLIGLYGLMVLFAGVAIHLNWNDLRVPWLGLGFAVLFRLTLFGAIPTLSDDIYRYAWEGDMQRHGINPYLDAPSAAKLSPFRDTLYPLINHPDIPAIYPPFTQILSRSASACVETLGRGFHHETTLRLRVLAQKAVSLLFDLLTIGALLFLLRHRQLPLGRILLYAWNPLIVLEFAGSGHNDAIGIFWLVLGVLAWDLSRPALAGVAWAATSLSKYAGGIFLPFLAWRRQWTPLLLSLLSIGIGFAPFYAGGAMFDGARHYAGDWTFNASLFGMMRRMAGTARAKILVAIFFTALTLWTTWKERDPARVAWWLIGAALLLSPTVYPWYLTWMIPLLLFYPHPAWLLWNGSIVLTYTVQSRYIREGIWSLSPTILFLEYVPVFASPGAGAFTKIRKRAVVTTTSHSEEWFPG